MQWVRNFRETESIDLIIFSYSDMFRTRENANTVEFTYKDRILSFREDCCCSTQA